MNEVLKIWQERLTFLQTQEPITVGADAKFALLKHIQEAEAKVKALKETELPPKLPPHVDGIERYAPTDLIGREKELALLTDAWNGPLPNVQTIVAIGGEGKTSLVAHWVAQMSAEGWPDCDAAFAWSFYSQGSQEQSAASPELFFERAVAYFSDGPAPTGPLSPYERGERLARLVVARRSLLILDGLEPLQYPPSSPLAGELKDVGLSVLLKRLAAQNPGLCVVTTRQSVADLRSYRGTTAPEHELVRLPREAGVKLLENLGVHGARRDLEALVEEVKGHALTLHLLGSYLKRAHYGDVRRKDRVRFTKADERALNGHAFRAIAAYEKWLAEGGEEGRREVAILRLLGLFDRPVDAGCLRSLRESSVQDLTEPLVGLDEEDWEFALSGLEEAKLLTVNRNGAGELVSLDAHPLIREYFARELREKNREAWETGHSRLFDHLRGSVEEHRPDTLEGLQPLYQAVHHGCQAGRHQEACDEVYVARILRADEFYSVRKLGAYGSDLGATACFFDIPWKTVCPQFSAPAQAWILNQAAFHLRALGRSSDAREPMEAGLKMRVQEENWKNAAFSACNMCELLVSLGEGADAVETAGKGVGYADRSEEWFVQMAGRAYLADALHQTGKREEALRLFQEAEIIYRNERSNEPHLYSLAGFWYGDFLLSSVEREVWRLHLRLSPESAPENLLSCCRDVFHRTWQSFGQASRSDRLLDIALDHLTLAKLAYFKAILEGEDAASLPPVFDGAVDALRKAGGQDHLPRGLLSRAWHHAASGFLSEARRDLDEAWDIAARGPMILHMIDVLLHRARLFRNVIPYPWEGSAKEDLKEARRLIEKHGYWRRKEELGDAETAIGLRDDLNPL
ncbi:MAG: hypothetical protein ACO1SV_21430 [Fimbriimonas sp.]